MQKLQHLRSQVYKWVLENLMLGGNRAMDCDPVQWKVEILLARENEVSWSLVLVVSCYRNRR